MHDPQHENHDPTTGWATLAAEDVLPEEAAHPPADPDAPPPLKWMRRVDRFSDFILGFSMYLLYPAILIVIMIDVIGRNFFARPLSWAIEGSGLFLIGAIFLAVPRVELDRGHILLDILYARYPDRAKWVCDLLTRAMCCLWMLAATLRSAVEIVTSYRMAESGTDFRAPFWPMRVVMTLGFLTLTLALLYNVVDSYRKLRARRKQS